MAYLLDTNVVSELRKAVPNRHLLAWHEREAGADAYVSALVIGEIRQGIERLRRRDRHQADALERWLDGLVVAYGDRILPVTVDIAQEWGRMNVPPHRGVPAGSRSDLVGWKPPPAVDGLMAATARVHRLTLVTRNVADVAGTGVDVVNPFKPS